MSDASLDLAAIEERHGLGLEWSPAHDHDAGTHRDLRALVAEVRDLRDFIAVLQDNDE